MSRTRHRPSDAGEFLLLAFLDLLATFVLGLIIIGGVAAFGHHIVYGWAFLIAFVLINGGILFLDGDIIT